MHTLWMYYFGNDFYSLEQVNLFDMIPDGMIWNIPYSSIDKKET